MTPAALLLDLDDTLYDYAPCERAGRAALAARARQLLGIGEGDFLTAYAGAREAVKLRCATPSGHARLLYVHELLHVLGASLRHTRELEHVFWQAYLDAAALRPGAIDLLEWFRAIGGKLAIVTDLTLDVQLRKLAHFGLLDRIDALVASEEVGADKPSPAPFQLAAARLNVALARCTVIGDNDEKDGAGARALGLPFYRVRTAESDDGLDLLQIRRDLEMRNS